MANPFPFVSGAVLTAAELNGIGEYTTFTPTFTGLTMGNATFEAQFARIQNFVAINVSIVFGSTTSITGEVIFNLPVDRSSVFRNALGTVLLNDTGTENFLGSVFPSTPASQVLIRRCVAGTGTNTSIAPISATQPMTWATTDQLSFSFFYRAA